MTKRHKLMHSLPKYAQNHHDSFIAAYGMDRALVVAKLTLEKIRASKRSLERRYGVDGLTCKKHPLYKAIRKPRVACQTCWDCYQMKHKNDKKEVT